MKHKKFGNEIDNNEFEKIKKCLEGDISEDFTKEEILIDEISANIIDIGIATFWNSYFRRIDIKNSKIIYGSDDKEEGRSQISPNSEELRGSLIGYCSVRKPLADNYQRKHQAEKALNDIFGE